MPSTEWVKRAIHDSSELSKQGEKAQAFNVLDDSIQQALDSNDSRALRILCRHASVVADAAGDLQRERRYRELLLRYKAET